MKKVLLGIVGFVVLVVAAGGIFVATKKPAQRPASTEKVVSTPELVARGQYLSDTLGCKGCHTPPSPTRWTLLGDADKYFSGGICWTPEMDFPGHLCASNLTSDPETGLGNWTDGEIARAIREGVDREGVELFPIMPYTELRLLPDQDVNAIIAFLRTLPPIKNQVAARELKPPMNIIAKFLPKPLEGLVAPVSTADSVAYGKYLVTVAGCKTCHTPTDERHMPIEEKAFSGGMKFKLPFATFTSSNLTPHETGLAGRTKESFIGMFRAFGDPAFLDVKVDPAKSTVMPWLLAAKMTDQDLGAIYDYLRTVPPVANVVAKVTAPEAPPVARADAAPVAAPAPSPAK